MLAQTVKHTKGYKEHSSTIGSESTTPGGADPLLVLSNVKTQTRAREDFSVPICDSSTNGSTLTSEVLQTTQRDLLDRHHSTFLSEVFA